MLREIGYRGAMAREVDGGDPMRGWGEWFGDEVFSFFPPFLS